VARAVLPIQNLPPGRYILRADVVDAGRSVGSAERAFVVEK
jgi:hypothetical protein